MKLGFFSSLNCNSRLEIIEPGCLLSIKICIIGVVQVKDFQIQLKPLNTALYFP